MQPLRLLLYGLNFAPEPVGVGKFTGEMAAWLAARGHDVRAIAAPPYYPAWRLQGGTRFYRAERWRGVRVYRAPLYVPAHPTGGSRLSHLASFAGASLPLAWWQAASFHPQLVMAVAPTLMTAPAALAAAALARARSWLHIQDFEADAALGLGLIGGEALRRAALRAERSLLRRFDRVSSLTEQMRAHLLSKGVDPGRATLLPNWVDLEQIKPVQGANPLREAFGLPPDAFIALYAGTLGHKQGLEVLAGAAVLFKPDDNFMIVLAGDGPARSKLAGAADVLEGRLRLLPLQPPEKLNLLLGLADVHLLPERPEASDLVMPSKLGGMLASGRPVLAAARPGGSVAAAVEGCGLLVPPNDPGAIAAGLGRLAADPDLRLRLGLAARARAERDWDRERILSSFEAEMGQIVNQAEKLS